MEVFSNNEKLERKRSVPLAQFRSFRNETLSSAHFDVVQQRRSHFVDFCLLQLHFVLFSPLFLYFVLKNRCREISFVRTPVNKVRTLLKEEN